MTQVPADLFFAFDRKWIIGIGVFRIKYNVAVAEPIQQAQQVFDAFIAELFQLGGADIFARGIFEIGQIAITHRCEVNHLSCSLVGRRVASHSTDACDFDKRF